MGRSQRVRGLDAGLEATADQFAAAMDGLGLAEADIAGHSHGGAVALMLASRHRDRVRSLILFAPANPYSHVADWLVRAYNTPLGRLLWAQGRTCPGDFSWPGWGACTAIRRASRDGCLQDYIDGLRVPGTMRHILTIVHDWFVDMAKLETALPRVAGVPTLLVWGDRDRAVDPASAAELQRVLPQAELRVIPGAGHVAFEEMPEEANRIMVEWLRRDPRPAASSAKCGGSATRGLRMPGGSIEPECVVQPGTDFGLHAIEFGAG